MGVEKNISLIIKFSIKFLLNYGTFFFPPDIGKLSFFSNFRLLAKFINLSFAHLDIVGRAPSLVNLVVVARRASCHTQKLAECLRRTFHANVQRANT